MINKMGAKGIYYNIGGEINVTNVKGGWEKNFKLWVGWEQRKNEILKFVT